MSNSGDLLCESRSAYIFLGRMRGVGGAEGGGGGGEGYT